MFVEAVQSARVTSESCSTTRLLVPHGPVLLPLQPGLCSSTLGSHVVGSTHTARIASTQARVHCIRASRIVFVEVTPVVVRVASLHVLCRSDASPRSVGPAGHPPRLALPEQQWPRLQPSWRSALLLAWLSPAAARSAASCLRLSAATKSTACRRRILEVVDRLEEDEDEWTDMLDWDG
jgi:hypothetical protein